ncbi:MAG: hypothetical protein LBQ58_00755 [Synergistaceae bacterium]|jgi:4-diphosphocytidyl-2-C-methyl-D-erythritol kinase|nr:hypothetical protein [Synergistaceae bacterium]
MLFTESCSIKINLTLRVLGAREDGYHDISSLFWRLPSPEVLEVSAASRVDAVSVLGAEIPGENILWRTCRYLRERYGDDSFPRIDMRICKHLPMGSGVGAGSGNAAALLRWFRRVWRIGSRGESLDGLASLGADVAFLASDHDLAFAHGVGDKLDGMEGTLQLETVICFPEWSSDTRRAYASLDSYRISETADEPILDVDSSRLEALSVLNCLRNGEKVGLLPNDFITCMPEHKLCYNTLYEMFYACGSLAWGLCGSGSACFALFRREDAGKSVPALLETLLSERSSRFQWLRQILVLE